MPPTRPRNRRTGSGSGSRERMLGVDRHARTTEPPAGAERECRSHVGPAAPVVGLASTPPSSLHRAADRGSLTTPSRPSRSASSTPVRRGTAEDSPVAAAGHRGSVSAGRLEPRSTRDAPADPRGRPLTAGRDARAASRTVTRIASGGLEQDPRRRGGSDMGDHVVEAGDTTATSSSAVACSRSTPPEGAATDTPARRSSADSAPTRSTTPGVGSTASCWRIRVRSAGSCSPARRPSSAPSGPELRPASLDQREHLQHPVVHRARQPGALGRGRRGPLGDRRPRRRPQQRVDHQADDRAADQEEEQVPVDGLGQVVPGRDVGHREQHRGDEAAQDPPVDGPREHRGHHPEARDRGVVAGLLHHRGQHHARPGRRRGRRRPSPSYGGSRSGRPS